MSAEPRYTKTRLWQTAFPKSKCSDGYDAARKNIVTAYEKFRERVEQLLTGIQAELPGLTMHDITHVDALWDVASTIAGENYPLNPAEALVLGGAFLLHDAAHCLAAYPGRLTQLKATNEWRDASALLRQNNPIAFANLDAQNLQLGQTGFEQVLFATLRVLHPQQAKNLANAKWTDAQGQQEFLFPDNDLRAAYGAVIGEIAESHWFDPHALEPFAQQTITAPTCLSGAPWMVDKLKVALLLRVADACHMDARRAPRFLMLLQKPTGLSAQHWTFQSKLHTLTCNAERQELSISGQPFDASGQEAWWLAFDAINLAHKELQAADALLRDHATQQRPRFAAHAFDGAHNATRFATAVPTQGWVPVDTSLRVSQIQSVVERFGGTALYGDEPWYALRELIQNARDAIHAARSLEFLDEDEGTIQVSTEPCENGVWLKVQDDGIGMSRYVLTEVLLDFGRSLWRSESLRGEWSGLAGSGFESIGQFGIGFFAIFMLGDKVVVRTRRQEAKDGEADKGWELRFENGLRSRPLLTVPTTPMRRRGTEVSVWMTQENYRRLVQLKSKYSKDKKSVNVQNLCAWLAPALDIDLKVCESDETCHTVVQANDWLQLAKFDLAKRLDPIQLHNRNPDSFGEDNYWEEFTCIHDYENRCVGRLTTDFISQAIGVHKGLYAGKVDGLNGLVFVNQQQDLARQTAIPAVSLGAVKKWATELTHQLERMGKKYLHDVGHTSLILQSQNNFYGNVVYLNTLSRLMSLGVSPGDLACFCLRGSEEITLKHLKIWLSTQTELLVGTHSNIFSLTLFYVDEGVRDTKQFLDEFNPISNLITLSDQDNNRLLNWLSQLSSDEIDITAWSSDKVIEAALVEIWGSYETSKDKRVVGYVLDKEIHREVSVFKRTGTT